MYEKHTTSFFIYIYYYIRMHYFPTDNNEESEEKHRSGHVVNTNLRLSYLSQIILFTAY